MKIIAAPSLNFTARSVPVDAIVLHATASADTASAVSWCRSPASKVSYHAIIGREGFVYSLVETARRAWHAGVSSFAGRANCNDYAIGYAFANRNDGREAYPVVQLAVGAALCAAAMKIYPAITLDRITTHAAIAPGRKTDPCGPAFDLQAFRVLVQAELLRGAT